MIQLILTFCFGALALAKCDCGYSVESPDHDDPLIFTDAIESDFSKLSDLGPETAWVPQQFNVTAKDGRGRYGKKFLPGNVFVKSQSETATSGEDTGLELLVGSALREDAVSGAEIDSSRLDIHWGSFRAEMKVTDINGTCAAFFWYYNDTQEIDMEFLSREYNRDENNYPVNLVVQTEQSKEAGYDASKTGHFKRVNLGFDPAAEYHEYRFDYTPGKVVFFADGKVLAEMGGDGMPSSGGHLILQHWSNGNPLWSGGPPTEDATLKVRYVRAYFNSSNTGVTSVEKLPGDCADRQMVCEVKDGKAGDDEGEEPVGGANPGDEEDEGNRGTRTAMLMSPMVWAVTLAAAIVGLLD